ncbi:hypothetical protein VQH23_26570 (plasmid) [Pararoseomonas sp. SCSIO 73927]|uniref:hypothetical protein n=1 Tax=Pararoseomonas sp. SCSIO 73927 TaxID=3114537 RepID=UPI0030CB9514
MPTPTSFRIYVLGSNGKVQVGENVLCADDAAALEAARKILAGVGKAEVWCGARLVGLVTG